VLPSTDYDDILRADLAAATEAGDADRMAVLEALLACGGTLALYEPADSRYAIISASWTPLTMWRSSSPASGRHQPPRQLLAWARTLEDAAPSTTVILWKDYNDPADLTHAVIAEVVCDDRADCGGRALSEFVDRLPLREEQTLTVVAHSFGSIVLGAALADHSCAAPTSSWWAAPACRSTTCASSTSSASSSTSSAPPATRRRPRTARCRPAATVFGGTWLATNRPGAVAVREHSEYFEPGSEALANIVDVVTGKLEATERHRRSVADTVENLVVASVSLPLLPLESVTRHYRGPGSECSSTSSTACTWRPTKWAAWSAGDHSGGAVGWPSGTRALLAGVGTRAVRSVVAGEVAMPAPRRARGHG